MEKRNQGIRLLFLGIYLGLLFLVNFLAFGTWIPFSGNEGLWFYSGAASIILGNLLVTPFFTKPVDALSYSVLAGTGIYLVNDLENWGNVDLVVFWTALGFIGFVLINSLIAIAAKDVRPNWLHRLSKSCMVIANYFGNQRVIFSVVFLFAIIVFHRDSSIEMFWLCIAWATLIIVEPDKHIWNLVAKIKRIWKLELFAKEVGIIAAYQIPGIILIRQHEDANTTFGTVLTYKDSHSKVKVGLVLNYVGRDETLLLRAMEIKVSDLIISEATRKIIRSSTNTVINFEYFKQNEQAVDEVKELRQINEIVGIVDQDTTIEKLEFEVIKDVGLAEGILVEVDIQGKPVIYQIMDGLTKEDIVVQKNKYGYARATALKIGAWNSNKNKFEPVSWLPNINTPVYVKKESEINTMAGSVGHFPKTNYHVYLENIHELVTYNTAILGILGIGKSMLSIELVERLINEKIKVICIDLTDQYATELPEFIDTEWTESCLKKIQEAGQEDAELFQDNPSEGGSIANLLEVIDNDINNFIHNDEDHYLKIYNPSEFFATKQLSDPKNYMDANGKWKRSASLWEVTPVEMTSIITETTLKYVRDKSSSVARVCLVFEEAHSLVLTSD
jgi:uncharacterized protein